MLWEGTVQFHVFDHDSKRHSMKSIMYGLVYASGCSRGSWFLKRLQMLERVLGRSWEVSGGQRFVDVWTMREVSNCRGKRELEGRKSQPRVAKERVLQRGRRPH